MSQGRKEEERKRRKRRQPLLIQSDPDSHAQPKRVKEQHGEFVSQLFISRVVVQNIREGQVVLVDGMTLYA
jgi:hypothetical protein